jgi:ribosomal protein S18 acetylase RimI-like enzyme
MRNPLASAAVQTAGRQFTVDRIAKADIPAATVTLARAFHDDPLFNFMVPNRLSQARALLTFMHSLIADARQFDEIWLAHSGSSVAGAAVWLPPGAYPRGSRRETIGLLRDVRSVPRLGARTLRSVRLQSALQRAHHRVSEPHWYLSLLGADPSFQRRGAGTALLEPVLERCDADHTVAYLETQKEENLAWYHRSGFEVDDEIRARGCPPMWAMRREPTKA